jgi:O-antigen/teichoic acid export membrane protein
MEPRGHAAGRDLRERDQPPPHSGLTLPARAGRNAAALAAARLATLVLLLAWQLVLARWLGPPGYGTYATIGALLAVAAVLPELGMGLVVVRDVARRPADAGRYLAATLVLQPLLAAVAYGGVILAGRGLGDGAELRPLLALAALSLGIDTLGTMGHNQLLAAERMATTALIGVGHAGLLVALGTAACLAGGGLWGVYLATLAAGGARAVAYWRAVDRRGVRPAWPPDPAILRTLLGGGLPLAAAALVALGQIHGDKLLTTALLGTAATGQLAAGQLVAFGVVELLSTSVLVAMLPAMARAGLADRDTVLAPLVEQLAFLAAAAGLPVAVCASLLLAPLAESVFGPGFGPTAGVLRVLLWSTALAMAGNVFAQALIVQDRQARLLGIRAVGVVLGLAGSLVLLPRLGILGPPVAALVSESAVLLLLVRAVPLPRSRWGPAARRAAGLAVATLGLVVVALLLRPVPLAAAAVGLAGYAGLLLGTGAFSPHDREVLRQATGALPGTAWLTARRRREPA